jgi:hypothetical protein
MYQKFYIKKQSGTYSEALEAYGLSKTLKTITSDLELKGLNIEIFDKDSCYEVCLNKPISQEQIFGLKYRVLLPFIKKETKQQVPIGIPLNELLDYPEQKDIQEQYKKDYEAIEKNKSLNQEAKKQAKKSWAVTKEGEFGNRIKSEFDIMREIISKPYDSYFKLFENIHNNQDKFGEVVNEILNYYSEEPQKIKREFKLKDEKPNGLQLYNPNQSKGLNRAKADSTSMASIGSDWIAESMKIIGALSFMSCQFIKVGSSYDMKIYVPAMQHTLFDKLESITKKFKKHLKSLSPIRLDIINILNFSITFIKETEEYHHGKLKNTLKGFYSVYQKSLGNARGVTNISFIQAPDFVSYSNNDEANEWIEILEQQRKTIQSIEENGGAIQGLEAYRSFLGATGQSALGYFSKFSFWYAGYLMQQLNKDNRYVRSFKVEHLNKFYTNMEPTLSEIIENEGFQAVASAIRNSTIRLQIKSQFQRSHEKFEIRYGFAQDLQSKSRSKNDLAKFIGNFLGKYNAETARHKEKRPEVLYRPNVRKEEEDKFYQLLERYSDKSDLIGSLLSAYGYALPKYEETDDSKVEKLKTEAEKLGYELVKIELTDRTTTDIQDTSNEEDNQ